MTLTLPSDTPPPKVFDPGVVYPKEYPEVRAPHPHLREWFDNHPPEPHPVRIRPVEQLRDEQEKAVDELFVDKMVRATDSVDDWINELIRARDKWHNAFLVTIFTLCLFAAFATYLTVNASAIIRTQAAEIAELKQHTAIYSYEPDRVVGYQDERGSGGAIDPAPASQGGR